MNAPVREPNITCPRCRFRHPASRSCEEAKRLADVAAEARRAERQLIGPMCAICDHIEELHKTMGASHPFTPNGPEGAADEHMSSWNDDCDDELSSDQFDAQNEAYSD